MTELTITLPIPPKALWPNARPHWRAKNKAFQAYKQASCVAAFVATNGTRHKWECATCQCAFAFKRRGRRDPDNLMAAMKAVWDGLVVAGLLKDDDKLTHLPVTIAFDSTLSEGKVCVTVSKNTHPERTAT